MTTHESGEAWGEADCSLMAGLNERSSCAEMCLCGGSRRQSTALWTLWPHKNTSQGWIESVRQSLNLAERRGTFPWLTLCLELGNRPCLMFHGTSWHWKWIEVVFFPSSKRKGGKLRLGFYILNIYIFLTLFHLVVEWMKRGRNLRNEMINYALATRRRNMGTWILIRVITELVGIMFEDPHVCKLIGQHFCFVLN